jgi:predicted nucleotidyltransferase
MNQGFSYPTANDMAQKQLMDNHAFEKPNNILGIQYILAGKKIQSSITFETIKRRNAGYYDQVKNNHSIQSATAIRELLLNHQDVSAYVPHNVVETCQQQQLVTLNDFTPVLQTILARSNAEVLSKSTHISEGFEHRLLNAGPFETIDGFIEQIISKRYTYSRIKRTLAHILCNVNKDDIPSFDIPYLRILGMNDRGRQYLNHMKHNLPVPLYTKIKEGLHPYLDIELRVTKVCDVIREKPLYKEEFKPVIF